MLSHIVRRGLQSCKRPGLPICVEHTQTAGRGVFATREIEMGELIHTAEPLLVHPTLEKLGKVCYLCLKRLETSKQPSQWALGQNINSRVESKSSHFPTNFEGDVVKELNGRTTPSHHVLNLEPDYDIYCGSHCRQLAMDFMGIESRGNWSQFHDYCRKNVLKFPLLAKRLACMVASESVAPDILDILCCSNFPNGVPAPWIEERKLLRQTLSDAGVGDERLGFLTDDWYAGVLGRLHLNVFRVEMVNTSQESLLAAAAESVSGEAISGSAVYVVPSMYNHDCDPNVDISWFETATARVKACRPIQTGEELRITYIDASLSCDSRQALLKHAYGFVCGCPRCMERD